MLVKFVIILCIAIIYVEDARILSVYPCPSISHQIVFRPLTPELLKRGHHVTVLTTDPIFRKGEAPENLTEIDLHDISYEVLRKHFDSTVTGRKSDLINQVRAVMDVVHISFKEQIKTKEVQSLINDTTVEYDLILIESFFLQALGMTHVFKAPTILVSSFGPFINSYDIIGAPSHPILYHNIFRQRLYNLTLWDKVIELYNKLTIDYYMKENEDVKDLFGPDTPPLNVLKNNVDMLFVNIHPIWEGNYPVPPNVVYMGGLHQMPPKSLPKDLQEYLDASDNGVIYFSFGTNVQPSLLPPGKLTIFENVLSELPYNVIWKRDKDDIRVKTNNIKVFKWLPQADLLRHPNIKLFITQGGLQSTDEAIAAGVPLLGIPMLGDQWYNVEKYVYHKIGKKLDFEDLTEELLRTAILEVIEDKRYKDNIIKLRSLMEDQPQTPLERAMWWIEYVLRHGGAKHLRAPAANMSWIEFLELDLFIFIISSFVIIFGSIIFVLKLLVSWLLNKLMKYKKLKQM